MKVIPAFIFIILLSIGICAGATNSYNHTYTTYNDLVAGTKEGFTTSSGGTISSTAYFSYYGGAYHVVPNVTNAYLTSSIYQGKLDWGVADINSSVYLNSNDYRHYAGGSTVNAIRYRFDDVKTSGGTTTEAQDIWRTSVSSKKNNVLLFNSPTFYNTFGVAENIYIQFDGTNDYGRVALDSTKNIKTSDFDITFMIRPHNLVDTSQIPVRLGNVSATDKIDIYQNAGKFGIAYQTSTGSHVISVNSTPVYSGGTSWKFIRLTGDNGVLNLYVDGVKKSTVTIPSNIYVDRIYLGGGNLGTNAWSGQMDEFRFYNNDLSTAEAADVKDYSEDCINGIDGMYSVSELGISDSGGAYQICVSAYNYDGNSYIFDESIRFNNNKPTISNYKNVLDSAGVTLGVYVNDADWKYHVINDGNITVRYYLNSSYVGRSTITNLVSIPGWVNKGTSLTGGSYEWYATITDSWSGSITTPTYYFSTPSDLFVYDESTGNIIDDRTVTVSFFTATNSTSYTTTDGSVSMVSIPTHDIIVSGSASGYTPRKTIIADHTQNASIFLINSSNDQLIYNLLELNKNSVTYPVTEYWIEIQKPINDSVQTVFASYLDFDGRCGTYFIGTDVYRLIIHSPDGTDISYGWLYPDTDGSISISLPFDSGTDYINDWLSDSFNVDDDLHKITYIYDSKVNVTSATFTVYENDVQLYTVTSTGNSGTMLYEMDALHKHHYKVSIDILTDNGDAYNVVKYATANEDMLNPFPVSYPDWFKQVLVSAIAILGLLAFSNYRIDVGCMFATGVICTAYYFNWYTITYNTIIALLFISVAAAVKFKRKQDRSA